jgi:hypothetical protein
MRVVSGFRTVKALYFDGQLSLREVAIKALFGSGCEDLTCSRHDEVRGGLGA